MPQVLNIPVFWICLRFWICQGSEYTKSLNMPLVLNLSRFWINKGFEYVMVNRVLNMPEYAWLCLADAWIYRYMREYAQICLNGFSFIFPYCSTLSTWTRAYLFQRLRKTRNFSLKEKWSCSLGDTKIDFFYSSCTFIWFLF